MTEVERKTAMTDSECEHWDNHYTENAVESGLNLLKLGIKPGFVRNAPTLGDLDREVAEYLFARARALNKTRIEVINDIVREKMAMGA